ncbi:hypothetical protein EVB27_105 [Rhizobium phage RHph_TM16]|nr:hypothetical protein EVB27_105 [Rhizobium phage RHph_TM16]
MRGRMRRYGIMRDGKVLDTSGFPVTTTELLLTLSTSTFEYKVPAIQAARQINLNDPDKDGPKAYAATLWVDVHATKAGKS